MRWIDCETDEEVRTRKLEYHNNAQSNIESDNFWSDKIKGFTNDPMGRMNLSLDNLPLPAAFKESLVSLRIIIKTKRKAKLSINNELKMLYWIAVIYSFAEKKVKVNTIELDKPKIVEF